MEFRVGALYSVLNVINLAGVGYSVAKVLAVTDTPPAVHVRLYPVAFAERPARLENASAVYERGADIRPDWKPGDPLAVGHTPLTPELFEESLCPQFMQQEEVTEEELDGFRTWENAHGAVWASPGFERYTAIAMMIARQQQARPPGSVPRALARAAAAPLWLLVLAAVTLVRLLPRAALLLRAAGRAIRVAVSKGPVPFLLYCMLRYECFFLDLLAWENGLCDFPAALLL